MTDDARKSGVVRHLQLALRLGATAEGLTIDEIASDMEVSRRTAQRMRGALDLLFPIETLRDGQQLRYRLQGHLSPGLLAPTVEELADLDLAVAAMRKQGQTERAERLDSLRHRLLAALRSNDRRRVAPDLEVLAHAQIPIVTPGPRLAVAREVQQACQHALLTGATLRFDYEAAHGSRTHEVAPRGLMIGARSYLVAHGGNDWGDPMLFRLDRMKNPVVTEVPAAHDETFDLEAFAARSFGVFQEDLHDVVLRFDEDVAADARSFRFHPRQKIQTLSDRRLEVRFRSGGMLELARHLFSWSGKVEIVRPDALREIMLNEVNAVAARRRD